MSYFYWVELNICACFSIFSIQYKVQLLDYMFSCFLFKTSGRGCGSIENVNF